MAIPKIVGAQRDFSAGELDVSMKRADENPLMKIGARQLANFRVLSSGAAANRQGRRALFKEAGRVEEILMSPGNIFYLVFGVGYLRVYNAAGTQVFNSALKGDGATPIPWTSTTIQQVSFVIAATGVQFAIYIAYADGAPANVPQVLTWDGVSQTSTWTLATYAETVTTGGQKRTLFYRISPPNITMLPGATTGSGVSLAFSANVLVAGHVGTRMTFVGRQILITAVTNGTTGTCTVEETLPGSQVLSTTDDPTLLFNIGDEIVGSITSAKGIITAMSSGGKTVTVQLLKVSASGAGSGGTVNVFDGTDVIAGPGGSDLLTSAGGIVHAPVAVSIWADEVMNGFRGYPSSVFYDQNRLGFCNFPPIPSGIAWSGIGLPLDLYVVAESTVTAANAIFELAPGRSQVLYVQPGMESSEFVFCDNAVYYIPINVQSPLAPGSVAFNTLSQEGCFPVKPQPVQQSILYMKAGGAIVGAVQAPGAYYRPYVVDDVSEFHAHLFTASPAIAIAVPKARSQFEESYAYILLTNGTIVTAKYSIKQGLLDVGPEGKPKMGWLPWNGTGTATWISAQAADVIFTTAYQPAGAAAVSVAEILDSKQYLDCQISVASPPAPFVTGGKGPLFFLAGGSVFLIDLGTRFMDTYQIDANGNIVPQNIDGENLASAQLVAGQPWTAILEPFVPDAPPGQSVGQRMFKRRVSRLAAYVSKSTGFLMARLFAGPLTPTSPALGTVMNSYRVTTWNQGDDPTQPAPLRESVYRTRPFGRAYDPRVAIIKDTPGPLLIHEIGIEATI